MIYRYYGNLPIDQVFDPQALPSALCGGHLTLRSLWSRVTWSWAGSRHSVRALAEPYRSWVRGEVRTQVEAQVDLLTDTIRRGRSIYTTPEGRLTENGRMTRFRASWEPVVRARPQAIVGCATTYDAFCSGRLRMWTMLTEPAYPDHIERSVSIARPVTASHIAAKVWRMDHNDTTKEALLARALAAVRGLPPTVTLSDDLKRHPQKSLEARIGWLVAQLQQPGSGFEDPRFPHVADMVRYYANQYDEILDHAAGGSNPRSRTPEAAPSINR